MLVDIFLRVQADPILSGIEFRFGAEFLDQHAHPNRIVCVATTDSVAPGKAKLSGYDPRQRSVGTRMVGAVWRLWATDEQLQAATSIAHHAAAEDMLRRFLAVLHREFFGSHKVQNIMWLGQAGEALTHFGRACEVSTTFEVPIYEKMAETPVAEVTIHQVVVDAILQPGESPPVIITLEEP